MARLTVSVLLAVLLCCPGSANAADQPSNKDLTLDECISIALSQNPRIVTATQRAIETRDRVAARRGVKLPQIEFRTDALKYDWLPPNKEKILGGGTTDVYSALNLSMLLFSSGRAEANIDAATARFYASQQELRRTRQDEALKTNPEYLRTGYLTKAAERDVTVARAEFGPNLSLIASYNAEGSDLPDISNWFAGVTPSIPIYTGGIVRARVGEAKAVVEQERSTTDLINQRITLAVRSAVLSTQDAANRLVATSKSAEQAQEALNIAQEKYAVGLGSTTEVIDTQVALAQAQTNYAQALYDGKVALAALNLAVGRDPVPAKKTGESAGGEDKQ